MTRPDGGSRVGTLLALAAVAAGGHWFVRWTNFGGVDEWLYLSLSSRGILSFPHSNRPLTLAWSLPAALLTPCRFEGYLAVYFAYLALQAWLIWAIVRRLEPGAPRLAFVAAALGAAWAPLDMARLAVVQTSMNAGVTTAVLAAMALLVESWLRSSAWRLAAALGLAVLAARSYEACLALLAGAPLLIAALPAADRGRPSRKRLASIVAWEAGVAACAVAALWPLLQGQAAAAYQSSLMGMDAHAGRYLSRLAGQFALHLAPLVPSDPAELAHGTVVATVAAFVGSLLALRLGRAPTPPCGRLVRLAGLGLVLAGLGYAVLALSPSVVGATRTQFLSAAGIALFLSALAELVALVAPPRARGPVVVVLAAAVVAVGTGHTVAMQKEWDRITYYPRQHDCLAALVRQAPGLRAGTLLLLIDEDGTWPYALGFRHAGRLVYGDQVTAHVLPSEQFLYGIAAGTDGIRVTPWPIVQGPWHERPTLHRYDEVIVFRLAHGSLERLDEWRDPQLPVLPAGARYTPADRITSAAPGPGRRVLD